MASCEAATHTEVTMTAALGEHALPWTEQEYLALGETADRIELFDGSLYVTPAPVFRHQAISLRLAMALLPTVEAAGLDIFEAINVRLRPGRIPIPDLVVARDVDPDGGIVDAADVLLVCEIMSPSNAAADRVLKMHYYAEARIEWYLLIDPDGPTMQLYHHEAGHYVEHAAGAPGAALTFPEPINVSIDPASLVRARR
jgi:Uma2 family endonuclease